MHSCSLISLLYLLAFTLQAVGVLSDVIVQRIYVSTEGNDGNNGTMKFPFKTLPRAQTEVRALRKSNSSIPIEVILRGGTYTLTSTLEFDLSDSGSLNAPITYQAYCDPVVEQAQITLMEFPYASNLGVTPRSLWNGTGVKSDWRGPFDPFHQMLIDKASNSTLPPGTHTDPDPIPAPVKGSVCVDKINVGHTCYTGEVANCVHGCMASCAANLERKFYDEKFYTKFSHLFGKDLKKAEDCVEICSLSCRGCEQVAISGMKTINVPTGWSVYDNITGVGSMTLQIYQVDLSPYVAGMPTFSTIYLNNKLMQRAGFPNCTPNTRGGFDCNYLPATAGSTPKNTLKYGAELSKSKVEKWTNINSALLQIVPNTTHGGNLMYTLTDIDKQKSEIMYGAGGATLSAATYFDGPNLTEKSGFRLENLFEELDAPGEWYYNGATKRLFLIPYNNNTNLGTSTIEIPLLRQLIRISGTRDNNYFDSSHASTKLIEIDSKTKTSNLRFRHLTFVGTMISHTDVYEQIPGLDWPAARFAAFFMETVEHILIQHCTFEKIGGNALMLSGEANFVEVSNNNFSHSGATSISILARPSFRYNSHGETVRVHMLYSQDSNVSFNQIHSFGFHASQSAGIMVSGAGRTTLYGNLIYDMHSQHAGKSYVIANPDGVSWGSPSAGQLMLIRNIDYFEIPTVLAQTLSKDYQIQVPLSGFDIPLVAKIVGAPECFSGSGRIGYLYGQENVGSGCSDCCSLNDNFAKIRTVPKSLLPPLTPWGSSTREAVLAPGDGFELSAKSSSFFNTPVDVYLKFHLLTPNQLVELGSRAMWRITTRKCKYAEKKELATCFGPCASSKGCGGSNQAMHLKPPQCAPGFEADIETLTCSGPFEERTDCDGSGTLKSHQFYNCSLSCFATMCT